MPEFTATVHADGNVQVSLACSASTSPFNVLMGFYSSAKLFSFLSSQRILLLSNRQQVDVILNSPLFTEQIALAGIKLGLTWNLWQSVERKSDFPTDIMHIFQSFEDWWSLPYGWKVSPVSDGYGGSNWLFEKTSDQVLVASGFSCIGGSNQCFHPQIWSQHPNRNVQILYSPFLDGPPSVCDLENVKRIISEYPNGTQKVPLLNLSCAVEIVGAVLSLVHASHGCTVALYGNKILSELTLVSRTFEWLHDDAKTYILKCTKFQVDRNVKAESPVLVLSDLIADGRVIWVREGGIIPGNVRAVVGCDLDTLLDLERFDLIPGSRLLAVSTYEEIVGFYNPISTNSASVSVITGTDGTPCKPLHTAASLLNHLSKRYPNVTCENETVSVPSILTQITLGDGSIAYTSRGDSDSLAELVHIV